MGAMEIGIVLVLGVMSLFFAVSRLFVSPVILIHFHTF